MNTPGLDTNIGQINFGAPSPTTLKVPAPGQLPAGLTPVPKAAPPPAAPTSTGKFATSANPIVDKIQAVRGKVSDDDIVKGMITQNQDTHPDRVAKIQNAQQAGLASKDIVDQIIKQNADPHAGAKAEIAKPTPSTSPASYLGGELAHNTLGEMGRAVQSGVNQVKQGFEQAAQPAGPVQGLEAGLKIGAGAVNTAFAPLAPAFKPVSNAINYAGDKISNLKPVQNFATSKAGQVTSRVAEDVSNLDTIAAGVAGSKTAMGKVAESPAIQNRYINQVIDDWKKPTEVNRAAFRKATEIFNNATEQNHNIAETLTKNKINPADNVENGHYATTKTADNLRSDAGQLSSKLLRPALEKADTVTPKTSVSEVATRAVESIKNDRSITPGTKQTLFKAIQKEAAALTNDHPQGLSLTDLHDNKITYDMNSKYSPVDDIATNNAAKVNRAIADASRNLLETKAPVDIPIKDFNKQLQKQYQAADYLDALNNKKVPLSKMANLRRYAGKLAGVTIAQHLGGGILGDVAGYHLGGMVENMFEGLPNPAKKYFLNNAKTPTPEAITKVQNYSVPK